MENIYADDWDVTQDHPGYEWNRMRLAKRLGGRQLGASIYEIRPGQKSFPYHFHHANEEMLIVLEGEVVVRTPGGEQSAGKGDAMIFTRGPEGAHQVANVTESAARIMMMSTMIDPDIAEYPDSGNVGVFARRAPGDSKGLARFLDGSAEVDYFEGS
ncbi:MAG: cupin domain-containing protein [Acidimicrobiia bacterium]|jgi:uncharacterized cupin superfamily protein